MCLENTSSSLSRSQCFSHPPPYYMLMLLSVWNWHLKNPNNRLCAELNAMRCGWYDPERSHSVISISEMLLKTVSTLSDFDKLSFLWSTIKGSESRKKLKSLNYDFISSWESSKAQFTPKLKYSFIKSHNLLILVTFFCGTWNIFEKCILYELLV